MSIKVNSDVVWNGNNVNKSIDQQIERALMSSAILVQGAAVKNAPKDTGTLKASITREVGRDTANIGTSLEYAPYVEFGTRRQRAQPYLKPALLLNIDKVKNLFKQIIGLSKYVD